MEINNTMDINNALLQLTSFRQELFLKVQALDVCIASINQQFTPQFEELDATRAENNDLKIQNEALISDKAALEAQVGTINAIPNTK